MSQFTHFFGKNYLGTNIACVIFFAFFHVCSGPEVSGPEACRPSPLALGLEGLPQAMLSHAVLGSPQGSGGWGASCPQGSGGWRTAWGIGIIPIENLFYH